MSQDTASPTPQSVRALEDSIQRDRQRLTSRLLTTTQREQLSKKIADEQRRLDELRQRMRTNTI